MSFDINDLDYRTRERYNNDLIAQIETLTNQNNDLQNEICEIKEYLIGYTKTDCKISLKEFIIYLLEKKDKAYDNLLKVKEGRNKVIYDMKQVLIKRGGIPDKGEKDKGVDMINKVIDIKEGEISSLKEQIIECNKKEKQINKNYNSLVRRLLKLREKLISEGNLIDINSKDKEDIILDKVLSIKNEEIDNLKKMCQELENKQTNASLLLQSHDLANLSSPSKSDDFTQIESIKQKLVKLGDFRFTIKQLTAEEMLDQVLSNKDSQIRALSNRLQEIECNQPRSSLLGSSGYGFNNYSSSYRSGASSRVILNDDSRQIEIIKEKLFNLGDFSISFKFLPVDEMLSQVLSNKDLQIQKLLDENQRIIQKLIKEENNLIDDYDVNNQSLEEIVDKVVSNKIEQIKTLENKNAELNNELASLSNKLKIGIDYLGFSSNNDVAKDNDNPTLKNDFDEIQKENQQLKNEILQIKQKLISEGSLPNTDSKSSLDEILNQFLLNIILEKAELIKKNEILVNENEIIKNNNNKLNQDHEGYLKKMSKNIEVMMKNLQDIPQRNESKSMINKIENYHKDMSLITNCQISILPEDLKSKNENQELKDKLASQEKEKNEMIDNYNKMLHINEIEIEDLKKKCTNLEQDKLATEDLLRRHVCLIKNENDKQIRRLKYLQRMEIKAIIEKDENSENQ